MTQSHTSTISTLWLTLTLCPLLAAGDTVIRALTIGGVAIAALLLSSALAGVLRDRLAPATALATGLLLSVALLSAVQLLMQAWLYDLNTAMFVFLPLLSVNPALLAPWLPSTAAISTKQLGRYAAALILYLLLLALAREIVGRGTVFSDSALLPIEWVQGLQLSLFRLDRGFLLALLAPGAFISLGLALAAHHWLRQQRAPSPP